jgi:ABC-type multidrug transport system fused ATPase/permease subunit
MTAVERLTSFLELPEEAPEVTDVRPAESWPHAGAIEIRDLRLRYREGLDIILKGLTLSIEPGDKVGICGRTVSG